MQKHIIKGKKFFFAHKHTHTKQTKRKQNDSKYANFVVFFYVFHLEENYFSLFS